MTAWYQQIAIGVKYFKELHKYIKQFSGDLEKEKSLKKFLNTGKRSTIINFEEDYFIYDVPNSFIFSSK